MLRLPLVAAFVPLHARSNDLCPAQSQGPSDIVFVRQLRRQLSGLVRARITSTVRSGSCMRRELLVSRCSILL
jgi:hypothetical protein